jgi:ATP-dependent Clp protease ATP-binding subunit ClpC
VLLLAQEEAERSGHSYIGTEHLLLGILRETDGIGAQALTSVGIDIPMVRQTIESVLSGHRAAPPVQHIIPTSRVKRVIEISFEEARRMGNNYIGTAHLLLGLLIESEGIAAHVLKDLGPTTERIRAEIDQLLPHGSEEPAEHGRAYAVGDRVLVHDGDPPYRLWEGRITGVDDPHYEVSVVGRRDGELMTAELKQVHPVPMTFTRDCPYCRDK